MLFCQQTQKTHSYYHSVTAELPSILSQIGCMHQTIPELWTQQARAELNWLQGLGGLQQHEEELVACKQNYRNQAETGWTLE